MGVPLARQDVFDRINQMAILPATPIRGRSGGQTRDFGWGQSGSCRRVHTGGECSLRVCATEAVSEGSYCQNRMRGWPEGLHRRNKTKTDKDLINALVMNQENQNPCQNLNQKEG